MNKQNKHVENASSPSEGDTTTHEPNGNFDWNRRAGPIFKYGLAVGFSLILLGGISLGLSLTNIFLGILVVCAGLSIILGAFGSTAKVTIPGQSIVLVGVAAVSVAMFVILMREMDDRYVRVKIAGDVNGSQIDLVGDRSYLGAFQQSERTYDFIIFGKEIEKPVIALYVTLPDGRELPFECIDKKHLTPYLGSGNTLLWWLDNEKGTLMNTKDRQRIAELGPCREETNRIGGSASPHEKVRLSLAVSFISTAFAQSENTKQDTEALIDQLDSRVAYLRRDARSKLAEKGISVIQPLLSKLSDEALDYNGRLGVLVALTNMMRKNKSFRADMIEIISDKDLVYLVDASADEDRAIRIYASEFLYDLGDPRAIPISLKRFALASANGRYNLLLVIKGAVPYAADEQKNKVIEQTTALKSANTPKTNELIDSIITLAKTN